MSVGTARYQLAFAHKNLEAQWQLVQEHWRDSVRDDFAEQMYTPVMMQLPGVLSAMDILDQVMAQLKQDCEE